MDYSFVILVLVINQLPYAETATSYQSDFCCFTVNWYQVLPRDLS